MYSVKVQTKHLVDTDYNSELNFTFPLLDQLMISYYVQSY